MKRLSAHKKNHFIEPLIQGIFNTITYPLNTIAFTIKINFLQFSPPISKTHLISKIPTCRIIQGSRNSSMRKNQIVDNSNCACFPPITWAIEHDNIHSGNLA